MTRVCVDCFGSKGLQRRIVQIRPNHPDEPCPLHPRRKGVPVEAVAEIVDEVFRQNFGIADSSWDTGDSLEGVLYGLTNADDDRVVKALMKALMDADDYDPRDGEEPFYQDDQNYAPSDYALEAHSELWEAFCHEIQHQQRFFNAKARDQLREIFEAVQLQRNQDREGAVYEITPGDPQASFYRARIADSSSQRDKIRRDIAGLLGPPPERLRKPGRMNPSGVCTFYGAFDFETCLAELRPTVGSHVIGAKFELTQPLIVLDTTRFAGAPKELSLFAKDHIRRMGQWRFMRRFMQEIARPISPNDVHLDYIPTQAVAEYLLHHHDVPFGDRTVKIEAIIYQSAQNPAGKNIAILGEAATVGLLEEDRPPATATEGGTGSPFVSATRIAFDQMNPFGEPEPFRIAARPKTAEVRWVSGATYSSETFYDLGVPWPDEESS